MFEQAARLKLRFATSQGTLTAEDLWDIPLTSRTGKANLDDIARAYNRRLKEQEEESFVEKPAKSSTILQLGFRIVKHIIGVRLEERDAELARIKAANKRQKIVDLIVRKKDDELGELSVEELEALL